MDNINQCLKGFQEQLEHLQNNATLKNASGADGEFSEEWGTASDPGADGALTE
ncbi:hypothetical protein ACFS3C_08985 [Azotobacter vinelandii]